MLYQTQHCYIHSKRKIRFRKFETDGFATASNSQFRQVFRIDVMLHPLQYIPFSYHFDVIGPKSRPASVSCYHNPGLKSVKTLM